MWLGGTIHNVDAREGRAEVTPGLSPREGGREEGAREGNGWRGVSTLTLKWAGGEGPWGGRGAPAPRGS